MKNLDLWKYSICSLLLLFISLLGYSQQSYLKSFNVANNVEVEVNASFTNLVIETWNKNKIEVEAYIDGDNLSEAEKQQMMKGWRLDINGNSQKVIVNSNASGSGFMATSIPEMDFIGPLVNTMPMPNMKNVEVPPIPEELLENIGNIQFDYTAFQKDQEAYMKVFEAQMDKKFGKDLQKRMEEWGRNLEKSMRKQNMDSIGESFGKRMESWGEEYGKKMEAWANQLEKNSGGEGSNYSKTVTTGPNGTSVVIQRSSSRQGTMNNAKRTIVIRMPKNARTNISVRHGDLKMAEMTNVRANLNYTSLMVNTVDGAETLINASFAPIVINNWNRGVLNIKFVDNCSIETVQNLSLNANSSDVTIGNITKQAVLSGSFGNLRIDAVSSNFESLNIHLENADAQVKMPTGAFTFNFNGRRSTLEYPKSLQLDVSKNSDRVLITGFRQSNTSPKNISINASYSNLILQ